MSPDEKLRLTHIAEAAALIADYLKGVSKETFLNDRVRQDAVIRRIQIIGGAVRHLSRELLTTMPDFPAKQARGMRNVRKGGPRSSVHSLWQSSAAFWIWRTMNGGQ